MFVLRGKMDVSTVSETADYFTQNDQLIEGVGNDVLIFFTFAVGLIILLAVNSYRESVEHAVHPELFDGIQRFRASRTTPLSRDEINERLAEARSRTDRTCPICIGISTFPILTNCGHIFCCACINGYWSHAGSLISPISCAICRTPVTLLLPIDWPSLEDSQDEGDLLRENTIRMDDYNRRFSTDRPWMDYITDLPVLIPYVIRNMMGFNGLMVMFRLRVLLVFAAIIGYVLSPFDMIPETVYGIIGLLDDFFVIVLLFVYISIAVRHFLAHRGEVPLD